MMEQTKIVQLLITIVCCVVVAGMNVPINSTAKAGASTQNPISTNSSPFVCADGSGSINRGLLCNGRIDCADSSDENSQLCNVISCNDTFPCLNGKCIELSSVCNGSDECGDDSDETFSLCWLSSSRIHTCGNGQVLVGTNITCNGVYNCMDKSDEFNCSKCPGQLMCDKGYRCVKPDAICDRIQDCFDGADESCLIPDNQRCNVGNLICPTGKCITKDKIMSGNRCWGSHVLTREENLKYCKLPNVLCDNATRCIPSEYRCDGKLDCQDGSDEMSRNKFIMNDPSFKCANGFCVPYLAMCDGINDCGDRSDERHRNHQCPSFSAVNCISVQSVGFNYWHCNNSLCIRSYQVNDGKNNCGDFSDEKSSSVFYFTCTNGEKVLRTFLCNGRDDCGDNSDEIDSSCPVNTPRPTCPQYTCPSGKCIFYTDICDGYIDCEDHSDEQSCQLTTRTPTATRTQTTKRTHICWQHTCPSGKCIYFTDICDDYNDCGDSSDEQSCPLTTLIQTTRVQTCLGHTCPSGKCILSSDVCNYINDCEDNSDETGCSNTPCSGHSCPSGKCIRSSDVCNYINDCEDNSDETGCSYSPCSGHSCPSGKCILSSAVCDGHYDCEDFSDESDCSWTYSSTYSSSHTYSHTKVAAGVGVPGVVIFVGGCFGYRRRRLRAIARTTTTTTVETAALITTTAVASDLPPSYAEVVESSAASEGIVNPTFASSA